MCFKLYGKLFILEHDNLRFNHVNFRIVKIDNIAYKELFNLSIYMRVYKKFFLKIAIC
jgi:hypothetical protein